MFIVHCLLLLSFLCAHLLYIIGQVKGPICSFCGLQCSVYSHHGVECMIHPVLWHVYQNIFESTSINSCFLKVHMLITCVVFAR